MHPICFRSAASKLLLITLISALLWACEREALEPERSALSATDNTEGPITFDLAAATQGLFRYGDETLTKSQNSTEQLAQSIQTFLSQPNAETLKQAQDHWLHALLDYRAFKGPAHISIADADTFKQLNRLDYQVATFPIQPGFLDKFGPHKYSGIVHDVGMEISEESLSAQHGLTDLGEAVLGLYPIAFMLFDYRQTRDIQDFKKITSLNDELRERGFEALEEVPNNRRRMLLQMQAEVLNRNIASLRTIWQAPNTGVRSRWNSLPDRRKIQLARDALGSSLTHIMLEVSELNSEISQDDEVEETVSTSVRTAEFSVHQDFIGRALNSLEPLSAFYDADTSQTLQETFKAMEALSQNRELAADQSAKDHWREMFTLIKRASDLSTAEVKINKAAKATADSEEN